METALSLVRNSIFSSLASLITKAANTLVFILIARRLTVDEVGVYSLALTYSIIFVQVASWGLDQLLTREVARHREKTEQYWVNFLLIRLVLSLLTYGLLALIVTSMIGYEQATVYVLLLVGTTVIFDSMSNICQAVFIAFERLDYITYASLAMSLFKLGATWVGLQAAGGLMLLVSVIVGTSLVGMLFNLAVVHWRFLSSLHHSSNKFNQQINLNAWTDWLGRAFPFIFITLFYTLDCQLDVVLLSMWHSEESVGLYGAATTILFALLFISQAFREAIFPVMSRFYPSKPESLRKLYNASARWLLAIALPLALGSTLVAGDLMAWLYKGAFRESGRVLQIIIWSIPFLFLNVPNNRLMIAAGKQRALARFVIASMSANLLLNVLLTPRIGYLGTALARLASSTLFFVLAYAYTSRQLLRFNLLTILPRPIIASAVMGIAVVLVSSWHVLLTILVGGTAYVPTLWLTGFLSDDERSFIKQIALDLKNQKSQQWAG
jgi:O-antigen/teichoic acid export membrane protein